MFQNREKLLLSRLLKRFPAVRMNAYAETMQRDGNTLSLNVYTHQKLQDLK